MKPVRLLTCSAASILAMLSTRILMTAQDTSAQNHEPGHHKYRLIDMGTFGGAQSYVNEQVNGSPSQNNRGDLVGSAETLVPLNQYSNLFSCFPGPNVNHAFRYHNGRVTDLGALPPSSANCSDGQATNDSGAVAGLSDNGVLDPVLGFNAMHGFIFQNGHMVDLGTLGGNVSGASSINNRGQVVGFATNGVPDPYSFYYDFIFGSPNGTQTRAFLWQNGTMRDLGTLGGPDSSAAFVNEDGQVAGASYTNSSPNPTTGIPTDDPFLWKNGTIQDLGSLGGTFGLPDALNNRGQVVGGSNIPGDQFSHPFLWDGKKLVDLGTLGGSNGEALAINDDGDVVGRADFPDQTHDAFLWTHGVMSDLGKLPGHRCSRANQINNQGQIVGNSSDCITVLRAFLWENGGPMVDLNTLIPRNSSLLLTNAIDVNDRGEIAGMGVPAGCQVEDQDSCEHAYLLIPDGDCDEACEQTIAESQPVSATQRASFRPEGPMSPAERVRSVIRERLGAHGSAHLPRN
jgi:probable HAF family extracellular repeat protein